MVESSQLMLVEFELEEKNNVLLDGPFELNDVWVRMRKEETFNWNIVFLFCVRPTMARK